MFVIRSTALFFLLFIFLSAGAQEQINQETNAPSIRFFQINSPNFRILYPEGFEKQAQRVANSLETIREPEAKSMGVLPKKISIILQNQSALSNGFVTLAPRRSEFYTMPTQNYNFSGTNDWLNALSTHEYRHIVQFQRSITGFNKLVYYLFGQQALAGLAFGAAPQWFWEGDAVATETAFTHSGRGRIPNFDLVFRTNLMEGRTFNYHKQYLRSYKNNIPSHYVLGYNMISYLRKKTNDPLIWEKIAGRSWNVPFIPFAFSNAIKKESGMYVTDLYKEMAAERKKDYEETVKGMEFNSFNTITGKAKRKGYTDYFYPHRLENGQILAMKSGIGDIEQLVLLDENGEEDGKYVQGIINDTGMISATNMRVVWNEYRYDPRWQIHTYSIIKGYDFGSKTATIVSTNSRYSSAAISPNGYQVATIESTNDYQVKLVILDYLSGKVVREIPSPSNDFLSMPRWTNDGKAIVVLRTNAQGRTISRVDSTGVFNDLLPLSQENIGYPVNWGKYILFNSPVSGIDNIYAIDVETKDRYQVTFSKYGAYNPSITRDSASIYYNDQTRDGLDVVKMPFDPGTWKKYEGPVGSPNFLFQHLVDQEGKEDLFDNIPQTNYPTKRYHRASGMFNPHSWGPYFLNTLSSVNIGISSQDILNTTSINAGYLFDIYERTGTWNAGFSYQGYFPILDFNYTYADRKVDEGVIPIRQPDGSTVNQNLTFTWQEHSVQSGLRIPLITTTSSYHGNFTVANYVGFTAVQNFRNSIDGGGRLLPSSNPQYFFRDYVDHGRLLFNHFILSAYRLQKQSRRDINSKWGQMVSLDVYNTPYGGDYSGSQFSFYGTAYFPGFFKHHSIWGYWGYQYSQIPLVDLSTGSGLDNYTFRNQVPLPRGQSVFRYQNFYTMSVNYTMPLWYPDIALGPLVNFQRVRGNGFYDYGFGTSTFNQTIADTYNTIGGEIKVDLNIMRFLPQFSVGCRYSYCVPPGGQATFQKFEILIGSVNF